MEYVVQLYMCTSRTEKKELHMCGGGYNAVFILYQILVFRVEAPLQYHSNDFAS